MPLQPIWAIRLQDDHNVNITGDNCSYGIQWIYKILNDCVWDAQGIASEALGIASILTWMTVSIPQMVKNCRNIRGIEGISLLLILMWTLGDSANLVGAILTKQLPLQIYLAIYFVFADLILFAQFLYFNLWWKRKYKDYEPIISNGISPPPPKTVMCIAGVVMLSFHGSFKLLDSYRILQSVMFARRGAGFTPDMGIIRHPASRSLLVSQGKLGYHIQIFNNLEDEVGYGVGVISSLFYVGSRTGQMYKNYKRQSTDGLSILMFILAVLGNLTYGFSIVARSLDGNFLLKHLPWLIGSLGVVFLDLALLLQFRYYNRNNTTDRLLSQQVDSEIDVKVTVQPDNYGTVN